MKTKLFSFSIISFCILQSIAFSLQAQVANFSANPSTGCAPLSVSFTDLSSGSPSAWSWNFGNGNTSTSKNPSAVYSSAGTYTVTLVVGASTKTSTVTVYGNPVADFNPSSLTACVGQTVTFTDSSTPGSGPITSWAWDFGDGNVTTTLTGTATHAYTSIGTFPVSLIITDGNGCSNSIIKSVTVIAAPKAAFIGAPLTSCTAPLTVNFTNTSTGTGLTYSWDFGDGTPKSFATNPSHTYTVGGLYTVKLVVTQGACKDSLVRVNYVVIQTIAADFTADVTSICEGGSVRFTDTSVPLSTSRTWDFGDGTPTSAVANPTHIYTTPGNYTVTLNATASGCSDTEIKVAYITVHPKPVVAFTADNTQSCRAPFTVNFTDQSTNSGSWVWSFGDGTPTSILQNPSHTYSAAGTYTVKLIVTSVNGCVDSLTKTNYILISPPVADFNAIPREGCIPLLVNFSSGSTSITDPITSYFWTFGDGNTTTTAGPGTSNTYVAAGYYTVKLVITTATGCKDSITRPSYIRAGVKPTANFNIVDSTVCYGVNAFYNNLSTGADSAFWQWGDGSTMPTLLPPSNPISHFYADTGKFTVTLIVYDKGCPDTLIQPDIVRILPPKPIFSYQLNCTNPYSVSFMDASLGADSLSWDFGDGSPLVADLLTPTHVYATRGPKTVTLTAFNFTTGCSFSTTNSFTIADPIAAYTASQKGCYPFVVTFNSGTSQDAVSYLWTFGDGTPNSVLANPPAHTYALKGLYNARLIITDINGCKDTVTKVINVQGPTPNFNANVTTGCSPLAVVFTDASTSDSTLLSWTWNFGDGSSPQTVATSNINHTYTSPGSYSVTMTVTDKNGCTRSLVKANYIVPSFPIPRFVVVPDTFACMNEVLTFNAATTTATAPVTYSWNFGDGTTGSGVSTTHAYTGESTFTVTLVVTDKNGCTDSIKKQILVSHPVVAFTDSILTQGCGNVTAKFNNKSTGAGTLTYSWDFGDGAVSTSPSPSHTYTSAGKYNITLIATNNGGCSSSLVIDSLIVVPGPFGTFSFSPNTGCRPLTVTFTALSGNTTTYTWDFGDGNVITSPSNTITHTYLKDITATPILLLGDTLSGGAFCQLPAPTAGQVIVTTTLLVDIDSTYIVLDEDEIATLTTTIGGFGPNPTYLWTPATKLSCTDCPAPTVVGDGDGSTITYTLTVTDTGGCIGDDIVTIYYRTCSTDDFIVPNVFTPNDDWVNDFFDVRRLCKKRQYLIRIYNRWGIEVFASTERGRSWDGRIPNGERASEGVYYYIITLDDATRTGFLHLLR